MALHLAMNDIRNTLARNLRSARIAAGWSQEEYADIAGVDRTYVSGVERAVRNPTILVLQRLAKPLGLTASSLLNEARDID